MNRLKIKGGRIPILLAQITSPHIAEVIFHGTFYATEIPHSDIWFQVDQIFMRPQFSHLRKVMFLVDGDCFGGVVEASICKALEGCSGQGILCFRLSRR